MDVQDLMIGDFIFSKGNEIHTVQGLDEDVNGRWWYYSPEHQAWCAVDEAKPIPLTPEILEKSEFCHWDNNPNDFIGDYYSFIKLKEDRYGLCIDGERTISGYIEFVHELQHALKFCKVRKELVL